MIPLIFLLAALFGASVPPLIKYSVHEFPPIVLVFIRSIICTILIAPFVIKGISKFKFNFNFKVLIVANCLFAANWIFSAIGIRTTTVLMNQIIYSLVPILVGVLAVTFLKEKINKQQIAGLIFSLIGMSLLIYSSVEHANVLSFGEPIGNLITVLGLFSWSTYMVVSRKISSNFSPQAITFTNFAISIVVCALILFFARISGVTFNLPKFTASNNLALLGLAFSSIIFFFLYQWLIKKTSAFTSSLINYTGPVAGAITGPLFFKERITLNYVIGAVLIVIGVFIATSLNYYNNNKSKKQWKTSR